MVFALVDYEGGFDGFLGLTFFQPIIAVIISILTITICLILGLPIRLVRSINHWWTKYFFVSIVLAIIGFTSLSLSILPQFSEIITLTSSEIPMEKEIPKGTLFLFGWFLTAFAILHTYPPNWIKFRAEKFLTKFVG